jgi:hypothetical protein
MLILIVATHVNRAEVIVANKSRSQAAQVERRSDTGPGYRVKAEADGMIERAIRRIHACQQQLDRKALRGPYGKQELVETIYGAVAELKNHRLANVIKRRLMTRRRTDEGALEIVEALIVLALPNLHPAVVTNWTNAIHLAEDHHVRPFKVRAFLYAKGGINRCSALYREQLKLRVLDEDEPYELPKRPAYKMPVGMRGLYDLI